MKKQSNGQQIIFEYLINLTSEFVCIDRFEDAVKKAESLSQQQK